MRMRVAGATTPRPRSNVPPPPHSAVPSTVIEMLLVCLLWQRALVMARRGARARRRDGAAVLQVAVRLADLEGAGPGKHRCKVTLLQGGSAAVPASAAHPSITHDVLPSPSPEPGSPRPLPGSRREERRRVVGTLEFVFQVLADKRTGAGTPAVNGGAKAGGNTVDGLRGHDDTAHTVTGFPSLDDAAESSGATPPR